MSFTLRPAASLLTVDRVGLSAAMDFGHADLGFKAPTGIGVDIDAARSPWWILFHDAERHHYAGILELLRRSVHGESHRLARRSLTVSGSSRS
jgi:hypothetical protein